MLKRETLNLLRYPRRWLGWGLLPLVLFALPALAREGVEVGKNSAFSKLVPAEEVESSARQQYSQLLAQARAKNALAPREHPQLQRLRAIARQIIPQALAWNPRARDWQWEVNLIASSQINAFCMPGGKIAFYTGILDKLQLSDDEVAMVMGHEVAHALREHARERMGKSAVTHGAARIGGVLAAGIFGIDPRLTDSLARGGANLLTLEFSREDESEADLVGMELAARAGYDPRAGVTLWQKMSAANKGGPPQWLSTHPSGKTRIADIEKNLPRVLPLYKK
ncbi:MAG: M48 family metallopeptidase [Rhodoferax sp.]|uniref:M48 family metallopeptidase n=1 Tax=Rhodoferax sp. TaxID=50421 RepID=UPI00272FB115|nr:M48 family metallopeptidase [Rhodoferax sp.]MDP1527851.1 M48 family metallopeptidase [Rhodoferax sp.]MDP1938600.1 M48 family metallopeptidase [Hylemonella sp.]